MTTREQWLELAARCETAKGSDLELDVLVGLALDWKTDATRPLREVVSIYGGPAAFVERCVNSVVSIYSHDEHMPRWSGSLDTITALIERELPGAFVNSCSYHVNYGRPWAEIGEPGFLEKDEFWQVESDAATEALARCAAFCLAMAERAGE